ncbi:MAG: hypothetical protein SGJ09_12845 [Phycisphaerae bacterium]|nr:hypothetical protein [Phycisphaerae bacterium]
MANRVGSEGFRIEIVTPYASGSPDDDIIRVFDVNAPKAICFDGISSAEISTSPTTLGFPGIIPEYCSYLGVLPTRETCGAFDPAVFVPNNAALTLLNDPYSYVFDEESVIDGHVCVCIELRNEEVAPNYTQLRAWYAPALGFAQVQVDVFRPNGGVVARWNTNTFLSRGEDLVALPLSGEFYCFGSEGETVSWVGLHVANDSEGNPKVHTGGAVDLSLTVPAGTQIVDRDSGETWTASSTIPLAEPMKMASFNYDRADNGPPSGSKVLLAAGFALFSVGVIAFAKSQWSRRLKNGDGPQTNHEFAPD